MQLPLEVDCLSVHQLLEDSGDVLLLDCREQDEVEICQIRDSLWMPMREIPDGLDELQKFMQQPLVVYCHHGGRSLQVAGWLREQGFDKVQSMSGGIDQWATAVDPQLRRY
jgi:adenylyltransferase/sulfurtransferase